MAGVKRILVCGGREFDSWHILSGALDAIVAANAAPIIVIEGGAKGADFLARVWAKANGFEFEEYPADWRKHGKAAGGIRNQEMLDEGQPDLVFAFPGGTGTRDMVRRAKSAGVPVVEVPE